MATFQRKCYVCDNSLVSDDINNVFELRTLHSQTPIHMLLEKFLGRSIYSRTEPNFSNALCQRCVYKFNEYDLAVITAKRVENELLQCYNTTNSKYDEVQECVEFDPLLIPLSDDGEGGMCIKCEEDSYDDYSYQNGNYAFAESILNGAEKRICEKKIKVEDPDGDGDENRSLVRLKMPTLLLKCQKCQLEFENETVFKAHLRYHDTGSKVMHVCDLCGQIYESKTALDIHVGLHKAVSLHKCEVCLKIFTEEEALVRHMPIHSGELPYQKMNSSGDDNFVAQMEVVEVDGERTNEPVDVDDTYQLLPFKSKAKYEHAYNDFKKWQTLKTEENVSETVLLAYFYELAEKNKPSSLWAYYSMLKATIRIKDDIDISAFTQINAFLKSKSNGYKPVKTKVFTEREIQKFIAEAPDNIWLDVKVVCIFGISGALKSDELVKIKLEDIEHHGELLLVRIPKTKAKTKARSFTITGQFYTIVQKYAALRQPDMKDNRFFVNYQRGKCTSQFIGRNKFSGMPRRIATYLLLPEPERYTGHSLRSSSKTILANTGIRMETTKRHTEYIELSDESNV